MADAKFVTILVIALSLIVILMSTQICNGWGNDFADNPVTKLFLLDNFIASASSCQVGQVTTVNITQSGLTGNFTNATGSLVTLAGGATGTFGISSFIDVIKLIFPVMSLLLGLPLYTFFFTIGLPYMVATFLTVFIASMYIIGWVEFIRGGGL